MNTFLVVRRELADYFATPVAYVFIVIFLALLSALTFFMGSFFARGQADLSAFFQFHAWVYMLLIPAITMRMWAEERKSGTIELLMTLPVSRGAMVLGKFLAAWVFIGIALLLTFPMVLTVNYLGNPDNGAIITGYIGSWLLAGGYLAIGSCMSALTKNQVIAFIVSVVACFVFIVSGVSMVQNLFSGWAPQWVLDTIASFSFLIRFDAISKGVLDLRDLLYFFSLMAVWLFATAIVIDLKKAD